MRISIMFCVPKHRMEPRKKCDFREILVDRGDPAGGGPSIRKILYNVVFVK